MMLGGAVSLAQLLKYGGDAQHIMDLVANAKSPEDLEKPAQELATLTKSGAVDILLSATAYGVGKAAPKITKLGSKAIELSAEYADEIAKLGKQKWAEYDAKIKKLGDSLFPEPEFAGVPKQTIQPKDVKNSNVFEMRGDHRINIRKGNGKAGTGMEYAWRRHGGAATSNKSKFSIPRSEVESILQRKDVVQTPAVKDSLSGNYIREVDVGKVVGNLPVDKGGQPTQFLTIITDDVGNLVNVFPGKLGFQAN